MDYVFAFASSEARLFGLKHMTYRATKTDLNRFVKAVGPATTTCLLCGHGASTQSRYCSNLTGATVAARTGRRCGRLLSAVALEVRELCLSYYEELFSGAFDVQRVRVWYNEREPNVLKLHWRGGLFKEIGISAAERLAPSFRIQGSRVPNRADVRRAARHLESLLPGISSTMGIDGNSGASIRPADEADGKAEGAFDLAYVHLLPWSDFELGHCGKLSECLIGLCCGESTVLEAISPSDIARALADSDPDLSRFAFELIRLMGV